MSVELEVTPMKNSNSIFQNGSTIEATPGRKYKRHPHHRVFVNRSLHLDKIKFYGFDMDYTLAEYKSPHYEALGFKMLKQRLLSIGYPSALSEFDYDATFPVRGMWFDKQFGNLLKVDAYGSILVCIHGFKFLKPIEVEDLYPNKFIQLDDSRCYVLNTLFNLPETYMMSCLVDYFTYSSEYIGSKTGVKCGDVYMSFKSIHQDVRSSVDWMHLNGTLKEETIKNMEEYILKDERLPTLLDRIQKNGAKTILITNSDFEYTDKVMQYLLDFPSKETDDRREWTSFFDYVVVDAKKPLFFKDGTILRKVDQKTGSLSIGHHTGPLQQGQVYSGGSCDVLSEMIGARGKDVLYVGDHIFGDILRSKKERGWRTFLIVPELSQELHVWTDKRIMFNRMESLECQLGEVYKHLDSSAIQKPDISKFKHSLREVAHELDMSYGILGSLFRSGSRQTFFASQVQRYADLYAASVLNLLHYPFSYMFRAPAMLMPHESTVDHDKELVLEESPFVARSRNYYDTPETPITKRARLTQKPDGIPHLRADTPRKVTHYHDDDDSDEESTSSEKSG